MLRFFCLFLTLIGCGDPNEHTGSRSVGALINLFDWTATESEQDPFIEYWSDHMRCTASDHGPENLAGVVAYSIQTGGCNWLTIEQPSLTAVREGDLLRAEIWHSTLSAPEPASARVGLATGEGILVQVLEPIPQPGRLIELDFRAESPIAKNSMIYFHISNHGANSWHLLNIQINPGSTGQ